MKIKKEVYPLAVSKRFVAILEREIKQAGIDATDGVVINFRDPEYDVDWGGYHPVEVMIAYDGTIQYITDFAYVGTHPYHELAKELDWDINMKLFQQMGRDYPIRQGRGLYRLWQANFCAYYDNGVFAVSVGAI
jgi:hypothetical protein